ncbi:MAG: tRNA (guanosine(46)-N7)-methyltransferase TrmB [Lachnospiraceae bacterium]|nr:tRNA (guanosine(46)-N7)-methyltransferase TrmB [Lachnospiraceae bacterium]MDY5742369.1 tRNA (guanosine(46)-N7)-methyltransferase TrmB [Lachnospiraceae bacterium]
MRLRNIPGAGEQVAASPFCVQTEELRPGEWQQLIRRRCGRSLPLAIEIGMGKGRFIMDQAAAHPDHFFLGVEMYESVLLRAVQKAEQCFSPDQPVNFAFLRMDAAILEEYLAAGEVDTIYLNFSDPWPKKRHAKRRLVYRGFLNRYARLLGKGGRLEFKTDNIGLFDFALEELAAAEWQLLALTRDLHRDEELVRGNIMTEYEEKFAGLGQPICKVIAVPGMLE